MEIREGYKKGKFTPFIDSLFNRGLNSTNSN